MASAVKLVDALDLFEVEDTMWSAVYDGLTLAAQGLEGIAQRPQCHHRNGPNAAGAYLEALSDFIFDARRRAMGILAKRPLDPVMYVEGLVRLQREAYESNGEDVGDLMKLTADGHELREVYEAKRDPGNDE